jgi:hypothetical protein
LQAHNPDTQKQQAGHNEVLHLLGYAAKDEETGDDRKQDLEETGFKPEVVVRGRLLPKVGSRQAEQ